jgi:hypothetical protein
VVLYAATDPWPDHPKPWYRDVYKIARGHGWTLETHTSHTGSATVRCPSGDCSFKVFATGRGAESVAKQHRLMIERCPHGPGSIDAFTRATELLDKSERLLDALDALNERDKLNNRVQALLVDDANRHEDEILDLWLAADGLTVEADQLLAEVGNSGQEDIVKTTDSALSQARGLLRPLPKTDEVTKQRSRASTLRARCDAYRKLISHS